MGEVGTARKAEAAEPLKLVLTEHMLGSMNLGPRYWGVQPKEIDESIRVKLKKYVDEYECGFLDGTGLFLSGDHETAMKAMSIVAKAARQRYHSVLCVSVTDLREWVFEKRMNADGDLYIDYCQEVGLLCLWGLGDEWRGDKGFSDAILGRITQHRHAAMLPTVWVSRFPFGDMRDRNYPVGMLEAIERNTKAIEL